MNSSSTVLSKIDYENKLVDEVRRRDFSILFRENINDGNNDYTLCSSEVTSTKSRVTWEEKPFILIPQNAESPKIHKFETELEYEGVVISVNPEERSFTARIIDVKSNNDLISKMLQLIQLFENKWRILFSNYPIRKCHVY